MDSLIRSTLLSQPVFLGLGSNREPRRSLLGRAVRALQASGVVTLNCSSVYETEPLEVNDQPDFLNLVCEARTSLFPEQLLKRCKEIEVRLGRSPGIPKGPREIDIDILFFGNQISETSSLVLPHPAVPLRRFVLTPLAEIAPGFRDPRSGKTIAELLMDCPDRSRVVRLDSFLPEPPASDETTTDHR